VERVKAQSESVYRYNVTSWYWGEWGVRRGRKWEPCFITWIQATDNFHKHRLLDLNEGL
jgi:hypothetical protein